MLLSFQGLLLCNEKALEVETYFPVQIEVTLNTSNSGTWRGRGIEKPGDRHDGLGAGRHVWEPLCLSSQTSGPPQGLNAMMNVRP